VNAPGATCCAAVTFALGRLNAAIDSHVSARADGTETAKVATHTKIVILVATLFEIVVLIVISVVRQPHLQTKLLASSMLPLPL
jgi:hypothetical protein